MGKMVTIKELAQGMPLKRVNIKAKVVEKGPTREVVSKYKNEVYLLADATIADETGSMKLTLWDQMIEKVNVGDNIEVVNGYVTSFKSENQLNIGKFGTLKVTKP